MKPSGGGSDCKTDGKPYDVVVATILLRARTLAGKGFTFYSDGVWNLDPEWIAAKKLFELIWPDIKIKDEEVGIRYVKAEERDKVAAERRNEIMRTFEQLLQDENEDAAGMVEDGVTDSSDREEDSDRNMFVIVNQVLPEST
jgi:hypothetical protein